MTQIQPRLRTLMTGLSFPESPRWHQGRLWLSDWGTGQVFAVDLDGTSELVARAESFPLCIDHLPDGSLLLVSSSQRRVLHRESDGTMVSYANLDGYGAHPWNDTAVDGRGNLYVNNIGFEFPEGEFAPGLIALITSDGAVRVVAEDLAFPNGMAVTPDDRTLIVAESYANRLTAFDIGTNGDLVNRREWASTGDDHPDGICLDAEGAVWYGDVGNQRCVRVLEGGKIVQVVELDRGCFACALGGPDGKTLYMITNRFGVPKGGEYVPAGQVLATQVSVAGVARP